MLLTFGALLVHGYHPAAEDAELYLPAVLKILHPELFPFNATFFETHAQLTLFPNLVAFSIKAGHLIPATALIIWQLVSIFLFLLACWQLADKCFPNRQAHWGSVTLIAALLTLPVAGTALYIMDQYVNPRNLAAASMIFAVVKVTDKKYSQAVMLLTFAVLIHPLMAVYAGSYCLLLTGLRALDLRVSHLRCVLPLALLDRPSSAYHLAALAHGYFYVSRWHWYEWVGVVAPLAILCWLIRVADRRRLQNLKTLCQSLLVYEVIYLLFALTLCNPRFEGVARIQPMRSLHLLYVLLIIFIGGLLADYFLQDRVWRWVALYTPLCIGMFLAQRSLFPASAHIEWPGAAPTNPWVKAFEWIRNNTAPDAIFALDPSYMRIAGEDANGFGAIAQRSRLADLVRDGGAVSMFPAMAEEWQRQLQAQRGWQHFELQDFRRLQAQFGVSWVVVRRSTNATLDCPYENEAVLVCHLSQSVIQAETKQPVPRGVRTVASSAAPSFRPAAKRTNPARN